MKAFFNPFFFLFYAYIITRIPSVLGWACSAFFFLFFPAPLEHPWVPELVGGALIAFQAPEIQSRARSASLAFAPQPAAAVLSTGAWKSSAFRLHGVSVEMAAWLRERGVYHSGSGPHPVTVVTSTHRKGAAPGWVGLCIHE